MFGTPPLMRDQVADRIAVIGLVREHDGARREIIEQHIGRAAAGNLAAG